MSTPTADDAELVVLELARISEALTRLAAVAQQPAEPQSSVEIVKNGRGVGWTVKCYSPLGPGAACDLAEQIYDRLAARYAEQPEASA
jgi:invasion protein IalB